MLNKIYSGIFFLVILVGSGIVSGAFVKLVAAQSSNTVTNVTDLTRLDSNAGVNLENKTVNYYDQANGYLVYPSASNENKSGNNNGTLPAVVMIHENKGLNDHIKNMANLLARNGYVVLAVDLFKGEVTTDRNRSSELTQYIRDNPDIATANLQSAVKYLASLPNVNADKIASLGWCFGGAQSLQLALNSQDHPLAATVIYYGRLITDNATLAKIKWPVLGIFGDQDSSIPVDTVKAFESALNSNNIPNEIYIFKGVGHAFANPSGDNYAPTETKDAWDKTLSFLDKHLRSM
ncbi:MAG: dienelactone hydrolase family protein [Nitrososphaeraceae archaeon]|nr:dienelactone hydrolase family protein [Nitrososphaeraceae archaeon]MDW0143761.1 dienelactone hydrolase family protein [Nitrososphaeraceae archaeon]MDW0153863.1 dienelactone hydrolase family protein [Nitrososphaeraceae archaeon]MDW0156659.1 dienelactone hydrolase family protein [Nitrososphaeraceae archaeon]